MWQPEEKKPKSMLQLHPIIITETDLPAAIAEIQYQPVHAPGVVEVNVE